VWAIALEQPVAVVDALERLLDPAERDAAGRRTAPHARARYTVAHGALRCLLGGALEVEPGALRIDRVCVHCGNAEHGKPRLTGARAMSFSLTHSGASALVAVCQDGEVGIDVERVRPRARLHALAERVLTVAELESWKARPEPEKLRAFLDLWTAKEALLKATGHGLVRPLRTVEHPRSGWSVCHLDIGPDLAAAVAVAGRLAHVPAVAPWAPPGGVTLAPAW
jgi:4'-phosphopantetheinyl transferase